MVHSFVFTLVRYKVLALLIISCAFVIISFSRQDWMREELRMKWGPLKGMIKARNATEMIPATVTGGIDPNIYIDMIPDDATSNIMIHFGLKKTCIKVTEEGFGNPWQLAMPVVSWCFDNKVFTNPEDYQLPKGTSKFSQYLKDEIKGTGRFLNLLVKYLKIRFLNFC